jgi:RNA polymerase sigma-70 factor (ECF subfamily)
MSMNFEDVSDEDLALLARQGNTAAFEAIYDRHAPGIARALASFAGPDRDLLDDLTQDVFFRVIEHIGSYEPIRPLTHWLYTIALNIGRNHVRKHHRVVLLEPAEMERVVNGRGRIKEISGELLELSLMRAAAQLPLQLREVVSLRIGSELPYGEIAEMLGIPEGTARSRMHSAMNYLKAKMEVRPRRRKDNER